MKAECPVAGEGIGNWKNRRPQWTYQKQNAWAYNQAGGRGNKNGWNSGKELKAERVAKRVSPRHVLGEFMAGCSLEDLHFLLSFHQLEENIYHLDMVNQSLVIKDQHLPWPVRFVLARFNRKHISQLAAYLVNRKLLGVSMNLFKIRSGFGTFQGDERPKPIWKSSMPTPRFDGIADSALCAFLVHLERRVAIAVKRSIRSSKLVEDSWKIHFHW